MKICESLAKVEVQALVESLADRLTGVKIETGCCTPAKVEYQALVNKLSARLVEVEFDTLNHTVVLETAVNTLADILSKRDCL